MTINEELKDFYHKHKIISILLILVVVVPIAFIYWYVSFPLIAIIYVWKSVTMHQKGKVQWTAALVALCIMLTGLNLYAKRAPTIVITSPADNASIQSASATIEGSVEPYTATVTVNGNVTVVSHGKFSSSVGLTKETNTVMVAATNNDKTDTKTITITRLYTDQEKAQMATEDLQQAQAEAIKTAEDKAVQAAYDNSPAGKVCKKHPDWSKDVCATIASHKITVGMDIDMVRAAWGSPSSVHTSNYGTGNQYQACWTGSDYSESCVYYDSSGIITSYN